MTKKKDPKKVARKAAKKAAKKPAKLGAAKKRARKGLARLSYDLERANYVSSCRLDGCPVDVYLDDTDGPTDVAELRRIADETVAAWPKLHSEFCRIAWEEMVSSKRLPTKHVRPLGAVEVKPFSLSVIAQRQDAPYWSFGLDVPALHGHDEYFVICRASDGKWTLAEVRSADSTDEV
ncbi:MAG TPA: hypothetical protein VGN57_19475 [Pirellulaceae bacterium]|jgi:hypothetical protein|nr:hypothetical protein [Pirellulaceae bacterium]